MRLLGWMHKKLKQTSNEKFKDFKAGNYCTCLSAQSTLDDHIPEKDPSLISIHGSGMFQHAYAECENSFPGIGSEGVDGTYEDISSIMNSDLFHGFLTIGTLGLEPITQPATPTFPISSETTEDKTDVTENDLKLISEELERFLEAEAAEEANDESLGRSSYVSTITLSGMEGGNIEDYGKTLIFPLQGYLFGSQIEVPKMATQKEKVTLGEMFQRTKLMDETSTGDGDKGENKAKEAPGSTKHFLKTMLKKFPISSGNHRAPCSNELMNAVTIRKKLNKVLKMFCRKVHPENLAGKQELDKSLVKKAKKTPPDDDYSPDLQQKDAQTRDLPGLKSMASAKPEKIKVEFPQYGLSGNNSSGNREYWIKTDANYLVLEL